MKSKLELADLICFRHHDVQFSSGGVGHDAITRQRPLQGAGRLCHTLNLRCRGSNAGCFEKQRNEGRSAEKTVLRKKQWKEVIFVPFCLLEPLHLLAYMSSSVFHIALSQVLSILFLFSIPFPYFSFFHTFHIHFPHFSIPFL